MKLQTHAGTIELLMLDAKDNSSAMKPACCPPLSTLHLQYQTRVLTVSVVDLIHFPQLIVWWYLNCLFKLVKGISCDLFETVVPFSHSLNEFDVRVLGASYNRANSVIIIAMLLT
jgi:hypothetical protein